MEFSQNPIGLSPYASKSRHLGICVVPISLTQDREPNGYVARVSKRPTNAKKRRKQKKNIILIAGSRSFALSFNSLQNAIGSNFPTTKLAQKKMKIGYENSFHVSLKVIFVSIRCKNTNNWPVGKFEHPSGSESGGFGEYAVSVLFLRFRMF